MALVKGDSVKNFTLLSSEEKSISLSDLIPENNLLLLFFPFAFSDESTKELCIIRNNMKLYIALKTNVAAISVDSFHTLREFKKANNLNFPLLSDFNKEVSSQFDCLYDNYSGMKRVSKRAAFVIDKSFKIKYAEVLKNADNLPDFKSIKNALG